MKYKIIFPVFLSLMLTFPVFNYAGIDCPASTTVNCTVDSGDLWALGQASWDGEGTFGTAYYVDSLLTDYVQMCNTGTIWRQWYLGGTDETCLQVINFVNPNPFDASDIIWPEDIEVSCQEDAVFTEPYIQPNICNQIGVSTRVDSIQLESGLCRGMLKTFSVMDWCTNKMYTHIQRILITDNHKPQIHTDEFVSFNATDNCESTEISFNFSATDTLSNCGEEKFGWSILVDVWNDWEYEYEFSSYVPKDESSNLWDDDNENGIPDLAISNFNLSQFVDSLQLTLPDKIGSSSNYHRILIKLTDACGNVTSQTIEFEVVDNKPPTPYCYESLSTVGMVDPCNIMLTAIDFNKESLDNCTTSEYLRFTFDSIPPDQDPNFNKELNSSVQIFTCEDLAIYELFDVDFRLNLYVWDEQGNYDFCQISVNFPAQCSCLLDTGTATRTSGRVMTLDHKPKSGVNINIEDFDGNELGQIETDSIGDFSFQMLTNLSNSVSFNFQNNINYDEGVTTLDMLMMQQYIFGSYEFNPDQLIAGDVNLNGQVSFSDILELRNLILGIDDEFSESISWIFQLNEKALQNFKLVESNVFLNEELGLEPMDTVYAIKLGDVNLSVSDNANESDIESRTQNTLAYNDQYVRKGQSILVDFLALNQMNISGFQFNLNHKHLDLIDLTSKKVSLKASNYNRSSDATKVSWISLDELSLQYEDVFVSAEFIAKEDGYLSEFLTFDQDHFNAEYYNTNLETTSLSLTSLHSNDLDGFSVFPNPISSDGIFYIQSNIDNTILRLDLLDSTGKVIQEIDVTGNLQKVSVDNISSGLYFIRDNETNFTQSVFIK